jgi:hypothetical protein
VCIFIYLHSNYFLTFAASFENTKWKELIVAVALQLRQVRRKLETANSTKIKAVQPSPAVHQLQTTDRQAPNR